MAQPNKFTNSVSAVLLGTVLISLLSVVIAIIFGRSLFASIKLNQRVASKKTVARDQLDKNLIAIPKLVKEYESLGPKADFILRALPTSSDYPGFSAAMENIGNISGMHVSSVNPNATVTTTGTSAVGGAPVLQNVTYTVSLDGSYPALQQLLNNIALSAWPMKVNTMSVAGTNSNLKVSLNITTYYQGKADVSIGSETVK